MDCHVLNTSHLNQQKKGFHQWALEAQAPQWKPWKGKAKAMESESMILDVFDSSIQGVDSVACFDHEMKSFVT